MGSEHIDTAISINNLAVLYLDQGRQAEAEPLLKKSLSVRESIHGPTHPDVANGLNNLAMLYRNQGRYGEAESIFRRVLEIQEETLGQEHADVAVCLNNLAMVLRDQGRDNEAEPLFKRSLQIKEKEFGPEHPDLAMGLNNLALLLQSKGRYAEAEPVFERALAISQTALGAEHPNVGLSLNNLAMLYEDLGRYTDAERLFKRSLAIQERALGGEHPRVAMTLNNIALLYQSQGRYPEAEAHFKRSILQHKKFLGDEHPDVALCINNLAGLYQDQGRYTEAEPLLRRALSLRENAFGLEHPEVVNSLNALATLYLSQGRYAEAERLFKRTLMVRGKVLGSEHRDVAVSLNNLARLYHDQGRYAEAEPLFERSLELHEKTLGPEHADVALILNNLAGLYEDQGRYAKAEPLFERSLALQEKALGGEHPGVGRGLNNLALCYHHQGRYAEAEQLLRRSLSLRESALGLKHPDVANSLNNLAMLYRYQSRFAEAEELLSRSRTLREKTLGPEHPDTAASLDNLAWLYRDQNKPQLEQSLRRRVQQIDVTRLTQGLSGKEGEGVTEQRGHALSYLYLLARLQESDIEDRADALVAVQLARRAESGNAFRFLAQRLAAGGTGDLASLVRQRQDLIQRLGALEKRLVDSYALPAQEQPEGLAERLRTQIDELSQQERTLSDRLRREFPAYAEFEGSRLADLSSLQQALQPGEAAVVWVLGKEESYRLIVAHAGDVQLKRLPVTQAQVADQVEQLHRALNLADPEHHGELAAFPAAVAADLFNQLFGAEWASDFDGIERLLLVPEGPLTRLAFPALLTAHKQQPTFSPVDPAYKDAPWLARRFAVSVLPSLSALTILREDRLVPTPSEPFLGVGDPLLNEHPAKTRGIQASAADQVFSVRAVSSATQIQPVDVSPAALRNLRLERIRQQPSLPDTAEELQRIAELLGAKDDALLLREAATEQRVKQSPLDRYGILSFATHGVLAGELGKGIEPGLILTPPAEATEVDDGFLSLSEVAGLELNADWVVLSACNTAAPEIASDGGTGESAFAGGEAEGLTGLAKAFTYAGAKALLVSHWAVASEPNVDLMEMLFRSYRDKQLSRAEAHRQAMLKMLEADDPLYRHPSIWAPFVLVGDGG